MEEVLESLRAKDTKERMAAVEKLQKHLEQSRRCLSSTELSTLVDALLVLLRDNNSRVCAGALQALASASALAGEHLKPHFTVLLPAIVERLGDGKQPVRFAARRLLLALMEISSPTIIVDRAGSYARAHKNWRVREEFARTLASAVNLFAEKELPFQRLLLPSVLQLLEDPNSNAREAAMACLEEMYQLCGTPLQDELQHHLLRSSQLKEILGRFDKLRSKTFPSNRMAKLYEGDMKVHAKIVTTGNRWNSPKRKTASLDAGFHGGESNNTSDKPVDPVQVYSEKDLIKEIEKVSSMLVSEQDWSARITAMRRIEGLIAGGAVKYGCFPSLVKQLVGPLSLQLADRRSIVIKQACNLLNLLSKELLSEFEQCAEAFVPVLSKLVVITVLVIAESADTCIKTMLRNCRVARVMPRIMDLAKNDRSSVLRARCCEYALLVLEQWSDSPEIQKLVDMYEDLIKCCVGDAMSEVRSTARACYRVFSECWPDRAHRLFSCFDLVIQKLINEERGLQKRYPSPCVGDKTTQQQKQNSATVSSGAQSAPAGSHLVTFGEAPVVPLDKTANILTSESKTSERSLERALQESLQEANAVEKILNGMDRMKKNDCVDSSSKDEINGGNYKKTRASASHWAVDPLSTRNPPFPTSTSFTSGCNTGGTVTNDLKGMEVGNGLTVHDSDLAVMQASCVDFGQGTFSSDSRTASIPLYSVKRVPVKLDKCNQGSSNDECFDMKKSESCVDKVMIDHVSRDDRYKNNSQNSIPGFQRPLMRATASLRSSSMNRLEEAQVPFGDVHSYMDGLLSLNHALTEGLSANADWSARVAAFNYLRRHLGQGSKGVQDMMHSFEKVMKLFSMHLNDPHHKVAQAALSTLTEVMPACRKPFEPYLERILPHVFARLVDPKEFTRQLSTSALALVADLFSIDSLFPALLRSLDEQRSPKAKMAVIDFTVAAFSKLAVNGEVSAGSNLLNLWLAKLASLANDKNARLKETAVNGIISVYTHFDSSTVLNFILSLTIEEQGNLRRALRQYTPRIETELMSFPQNRSQKPRSRHNHEQLDASSTLDDRLMLGRTKSSDTTNQLHGNSSLSVGNEKIWKRSVIGPGESVHYENKLAQSSMDDISGEYFPCYEPPTLQKSTFPTEIIKSRNVRGTSEVLRERVSAVSCNNLESNGDDEIAKLSQMNAQQYLKNIHCYTSPRERENTRNCRLGNEQSRIKAQSKSHVKHSLEEEIANLPVLLNQLCSGSDEKAVEMKRSALQKFLQLSKGDSVPIWSQFRNQILTGLLEALDDADPSVRELALLTVLEMLGNQKDILEKESVKAFLEKLLHCTGDLIPKISTAADRCISIMLSQYDPHHCLSVIVPHLNSDEEKMLVTCIGSLTKLAVRIPSENLMSQLPCFLPALFDAFSHRSADVRKAVVFCLVDIYIVLGQAFLPYLSTLSSTQLRLVTIYANRISQARSRAPLNS